MEKEDMKENFSTGEIKAISAIPIGNPNCSDSLVWHTNPNGCYSVKSGYHSINNSLTFSLCRSSDDPMNNRMLWRSIWKIKAPQRSKLSYGKSATMPFQLLLTLLLTLKRETLNAKDVNKVVNLSNISYFYAPLHKQFGVHRISITSQGLKASQAFRNGGLKLLPFLPMTCSLLLLSYVGISGKQETIWFLEAAVKILLMFGMTRIDKLSNSIHLCSPNLKSRYSQS
ncbi:hypothetical protein GQ457_09G020420 [Hibiscus cannabinus]